MGPFIRHNEFEHGKVVDARWADLSSSETDDLLQGWET